MTVIFKCEVCLRLHRGKYGSGRFCTKKCAKSFSTQKKREEINRKVSERLKGKQQTRTMHVYSEERKAKQRATFNKRREERLASKTFDELTKDDKRLVIFREQNGSCISCKLSEWLGQPIPLEIEHKDGDRRNNSRDNLSLLCNNCHALTSTWRGRNVKSKRVVPEEVLTEAILKSTSISSALESAGLNGKGNNYVRIKKIIRKLHQDERYVEYIEQHYSKTLKNNECA